MAWSTWEDSAAWITERGSKKERKRKVFLFMGGMSFREVVDAVEDAGWLSIAFRNFVERYGASGGEFGGLSIHVLGGVKGMGFPFSRTSMSAAAACGDLQRAAGWTV